MSVFTIPQGLTAVHTFDPLTLSWCCSVTTVQTTEVNQPWIQPFILFVGLFCLWILFSVVHGAFICKSTWGLVGKFF